MDEIEEKLNTCIAHRGALTDWEEKFVDDISDRVAQGRELTMRQEEVLDKIYTKCVRRRR